jgi:hypothetical protein
MVVLHDMPARFDPAASLLQQVCIVLFLQYPAMMNPGQGTRYTRGPVSGLSAALHV